MMDLTVRKNDFLFDNFFDRYMKWFDEESTWYPSVNMYEKDGAYHLEAELPGLKKEDVSITFEDGVLTIKGEKRSSKEDNGVDFYVKETRCGSFSRSFRVGPVESDKINAEYVDGVLNVSIPKGEQPKSKKIEVK